MGGCASGVPALQINKVQAAVSYRRKTSWHFCDTRWQLIAQTGFRFQSKQTDVRFKVVYHCATNTIIRKIIQIIDSCITKSQSLTHGMSRRISLKSII